jgi:spore coat protein U-like protein
MRSFTSALIPLAIAGIACVSPASAQAPGAPQGCLIDAEEVDFGAYDVFNRVSSKGVGRVTFRCSGLGPAAPLRVSVSEGNSGDFERRTLVSGRDSLSYNLYIDNARRRIAGNGLGGTFLLESRTPTAFVPLTRFVIYAEIEPRQFVRPGFYSDQVRILVEF